MKKIINQTIREYIKNVLLFLLVIFFFKLFKSTWRTEFEIKKEKNKMNNIIKLAECSLAENKHLIQIAISLSCGHHICKKCIPQNSNNSQIKCLKCGKINNIDLSKCEEADIIKALLESNIDTFYDSTCNSLNEEMKKYESMFFHIS